MVDDPYKVLGISRDATKDEIKKAYRQKAKEYHPDLHPDDPQAAEKMNEINEAYDMLNNPEKYQKREQQSYHRQENPYGSSQGSYRGGYYGGSYGQGPRGGYGGFGDFDFDDLFGFGRRTYATPKAASEPGDSPDIRQAVDLINIGEYARANATLNSILSAQRDARWYYLSALANFGLGNQLLAVEQIQRAIRKDPCNGLYTDTLQTFQRSASAYAQDGQEFQQYAMNLNKMCGCFCAAQLLCMCCWF